MVFPLMTYRVDGWISEFRHPQVAVVAGSSGSGVSHVLSFAARGCSCFAGCPRRLASAFLTWPWRGLRGESNPTFSNGVARLDFARHLFSAGGSQGQGLAACSSFAGELQRDAGRTRYLLVLFLGL